MMVLCDRWGRVYDVWICFGSVHEGRAFRERKRRSLWFRKLVEIKGKSRYASIASIPIDMEEKSYTLFHIKDITDKKRTLSFLSIGIQDWLLLVR